MTRYRILYWRDIPAQIKIYQGRRGVAHPLPDHFQLAIDRIAMEEGLADADAYLELWRWTEAREREGTPEEVLSALRQELEEEYRRRVAAEEQGDARG